MGSDTSDQVDLGPVQSGNEEKGVSAHCSVGITEGAP